jgi:hypothetical protein
VYDVLAQDAYELYQALLGALEAEAALPPVRASLLRAGSAARAGALWTAALPLQGLLGSRLVCGLCGYRSRVQLAAFESLSLGLPPAATTAGGAPPTLSLDLLLHDHFRAEHIAGYRCPRCSLLATRQALVRRLPIPTLLRTLADVWQPATPTTAAPSPLARSEDRAVVDALRQTQRLLDDHAYDAVDALAAVPLVAVVSPLVTKQLTLCRVRGAGRTGPPPAACR